VKGRVKCPAFRFFRPAPQSYAWLVDDGGPTGGIERAAQQGIDAFEAQQFPDPMPATSAAPIGPPTQPEIPGMSQNELFSRPHFMEGGWNVSADRMSWWNGVMWVPGRPPGSPAADDAETPGSSTSPWAGAQVIVFVVGLATMAVIAYIAWQAFQAMPTAGRYELRSTRSSPA
jgi:hypothetical protein